MDLQSNNQPWQGKGVSKNTRLFARVGLYLTSFMTCCLSAGFIFIAATPSRKTGNFWEDTFPYIAALGIIVGLIFLDIKLIRLSLAPISFVSSYDHVEPHRLGELFEVWYQNSLGLYNLKGPLIFDQNGLIMPKTLLPLDRNSVTLPYASISDFNVKGRYIAFYIDLQVANIGSKPLYALTWLDLIERLFQRRKVEFYVSEVDGERMYRELKKHSPSAVAQYIF